MDKQQMNFGGERMDVGEAIDRRVADVLERVPAVNIHADFAARVAGQVPARGAVAVRGSRYGWMAARICVAVLLIAIVAVAMRASDRRTINIALEWILCGELVGLSMWMGGVWRLSGPEA